MAVRRPRSRATASASLPPPRRRGRWRRGPPTWIGRALSPAAGAAGPPVAGENPSRPFPDFGSVGEAGPEARGRRHRGARRPPALDRGTRRRTRREWRKRSTVEPDSRRQRRVPASVGLKWRPPSWWPRAVGGRGTSRWRPRRDSRGVRGRPQGPVLAHPRNDDHQLAAGHHGRPPSGRTRRPPPPSPCSRTPTAWPPKKSRAW